MKNDFIFTEIFLIGYLYFKTGAAGSGKTYMVNCVKKYIVEDLQASQNFIKLAAPTGTYKISIDINV